MKNSTIFGRVGEQSNNLESLVMTGANTTRTAASGTTANKAGQLVYRAQFSAMVFMYSQMAYFIKGAWENKKRTLSFFNLFMKENLGVIRLYFTKTEASERAAVVAPYRISKGSLTPIELTARDNMLISSIRVSEGFTLTSTTTLGEVTKALLAVNSYMRDGDQISIVHQVQSISSEGIPRVSVKLHEFTLDKGSGVLFYPEIPQSLFYVTGNYIGTDANAEEGGMAYVLSRKQGSKLLVSSQKIVLTPGNNTYKKYASEEKKKEAAESYENTDPYFVEPGTISRQDSEDTYFSVTAVTKNGSPVQKGTEELAVMSGDTIEIQGTKLSEVGIKVNLLTDPTGSPFTVNLSSLGTATVTDTSITIVVTMERADMLYLLRADNEAVLFNFA